MKISKLLVLTILVAAPLFLGSCQGPGGSDGSVDFVGTWRADLGGGEIATITFTTAALHLDDTVNGTQDVSITSYDESARHILTKNIAATGNYAAGFVPNGVLYWLYSINANQMEFATSATTYPASVNPIPFLKQ